MSGVLAAIESFNAGRDPERLAMKYARMSASPFGFMRGSCHLFHERARQMSGDLRALRKAPLAWCCGDLHLENFGSYKGDNRLVYFDINDFDEAALAPAGWDLLRLLASVWVAGETLHASPSHAKSLCKSLLAAYEQALLAGPARWIERDTAQGLIRQLLDSLRDRTRVAFLDSRTQHRAGKGRARGREPTQRKIRCDGRHALAASAEEQARVVKLMARFAAGQPNPGFFEVLDVARRIAGTGSLGVERYSVLVAGKGSPDGNYLLDLKQALPSALAAAMRTPQQPDWASQAHRVVALQHRMQAVSMAFLHPLVKGRRSYILRGLQPTEDRVALGTPPADQAAVEGLLQAMGRLLAWAQLRSAGRQGSATADELMEFVADRRRWQADLIDAARASAGQVRLHWQEFVAARAAGEPALSAGAWRPRRTAPAGR
jgi:uncharacterized protein (DUF2252 family)